MPNNSHQKLMQISRKHSQWQCVTFLSKPPSSAMLAKQREECVRAVISQCCGFALRRFRVYRVTERRNTPMDVTRIKQRYRLLKWAPFQLLPFGESSTAAGGKRTRNYFHNCICIPIQRIQVYQGSVTVVQSLIKLIALLFTDLQMSGPFILGCSGQISDRQLHTYSFSS